MPLQFSQFFFLQHHQLTGGNFPSSYFVLPLDMVPLSMLRKGEGEKEVTRERRKGRSMAHICLSLGGFVGFFRGKHEGIYNFRKYFFPLFLVFVLSLFFVLFCFVFFSFLFKAL
uniref:Transmembrane protein n=1 Tax=Cacopsylla melanoneura TaxID=428564 RepID=A0A8D9BC79_9HEMI